MNQPDQPPLIDLAEYARLVRDTSDEDLRAGLRTNGEQIVQQIFQFMPAQLRRGAGGGAPLVAEWHIQGLDGDAPMRWQVVLEEGHCTVARHGRRSSDITFSVGALDFVKLVTGNAKGPVLFLLGRLKIRGDLLRAARLQGCFHFPDAASQPAE